MRKTTRLLFLLGTLVVLAAVSASPAHADSTGNTGQPNQSCQSFFGDNGPFTPQGFNTPGFNNQATQVYAGAGANTNTPANGAAVSQYDVACFQAASH